MIHAKIDATLHDRFCKFANIWQPLVDKYLPQITMNPSWSPTARIHFVHIPLQLILLLLLERPPPLIPPTPTILF